MVFKAAPSTEGIYHVKAYSTGNDRYWKYRSESERWIELTTFQDTDDFKFKIKPVAGSSGRFNIEPVAEEYIHFAVSDTKDKYRQHGFARGLPNGRQSRLAGWKVVTTSNQYSKLSCVEHPTNPAYVLDNTYGQSSGDWCVHFWDESPTAPLQRWVFELIGEKDQSEDVDTHNNGGTSGGGQKYAYLDRRAIRPVNLSSTRFRLSTLDSGLPDIDNVQGDVYYMFPKRFESFIFFTINDATRFRADLSDYIPHVTSSRKTIEHINAIHAKSRNSTEDHISTQIAFSRLGLQAIGISDQLRDPYFDAGPMKNQRTFLGDRAQWDKVFDDGTVHGVIIVTAKSKERCEQETTAIRGLFNSSVSDGNVTIMRGRVRKNDGEFFGFKDGVSQPAISGLSVPRNGQIVVRPGVIIMGYPGDPVFDNENLIQRPSFTKDGSFLVFRKLEQAVLSFQDYAEKNWRSVPRNPDKDTTLDDETRKALFSARLIGRWQSGVPLALSPYRDDPYYAHPERINAFDYTERNNSSIPSCPFNAHVRKVVARSSPIIAKELLVSSMIVRTGIPYGEEIKQKDKDAYEQAKKEGKYESSDRGLLFTCYQSSLENGFVRQSTGFASNDFWPATSIVPTNHGQDPIIGGPPDPVQAKDFTLDISQDGPVHLRVTGKDSKRYTIQGFSKGVSTSATAYENDYFVTSRGGEWFFVPGISALKSWAKK